MKKPRKLSKEKRQNNKLNKNDSLNENEISQEQYPPINKDSFIKGLSLVFIYFSLIIYSLLYMLAPEKTANLIFEGDSNSLSYNYSLYKNNTKLYKLDSIRVRENMTIIGISKDFHYDNNSYIKNNYSIEIMFSGKNKIINKIVILNNFKSKELDIGIKIYLYYKVNDFPFWLALYNSDDIMNITSDNFNNFSFDI